MTKIEAPSFTNSEKKLLHVKQLKDELAGVGIFRACLSTNTV